MCNKLKNQTLYIVLVTFLELELPRPAGTTILVVNPILDWDWDGLGHCTLVNFSFYHYQRPRAHVFGLVHAHACSDWVDI
jgi:hypothetical protein